jgi:hypothetical protein
VTSLSRSLGGAHLINALQKAARLPGSGEFQDDFTIVLLDDGGTEP